MPQESHVFEVEMPNGHILEIEAPQDIPQEKIRSRAKQWWDTEQIKAKQAERYPASDMGQPTIAPTIGKYFRQDLTRTSERTAAQVAQDQAANVLAGVPQAVTGIPGAIAQMGRTAIQAGTQGVLPAAIRTVADMATPWISTPGQQTGPEDPRYAAAAQLGGAMLAGAELPNALEGLGQVPAVQAAGQKAAALTNKVTAPLRRMTSDVPVDSAGVNKWMGVSDKAVEYGANPGKRLLDEGLIRPTKEATVANVRGQMNKVGAELDSRLKAAGHVEIDAQTPVYDAVAKATKRIGRPREASFQATLDGIVDDIEARYPNLNKLTPSDAHALKVELGDSINWHGAAFDEPANQAMVEIYRKLNDAIKSNVPRVAELQDAYGDLRIAANSLRTGMAKDVVGTGTGSAFPSPAPSPLKRVTNKYGPHILIGGGTAGGIYELLRSH